MSVFQHTANKYQYGTNGGYKIGHAVCEEW